jgi:hypothetical protein
MDPITLRVTNDVVDQVRIEQVKSPSAAENSMRIAIVHRDTSSDLVQAVLQARHLYPLPITIGGSLHLLVGDVEAIWLKHQRGDAQRVKDFMDLYEFLKERKDVDVTFSGSQP